MKQFKHYIITRFNVGFLECKNVKIDTELWMQHRMKLFLNITLPSIIGQTCQDFTWFIILDDRTDPKYLEMFKRIGYPNIKLLYINCLPTDNAAISALILENIPAGDYDLITTRIDNDDAFCKNAISIIQQWYAPRPAPWTIVFPFGTILDLATQQLFPIEYMTNNLPTLIESSVNAKTIFHWTHEKILAGAQEFIIFNHSWLQVIHSNNIANTFKGSRGTTIHTDMPLSLDVLDYYNVAFEDIEGIEANPLQADISK